MKKLSILLFTLLLFTNSSLGAASKPKVLLTDFRGMNLFETFYIYDTKKNKYIFVNLDAKSYRQLTKENKKIYKTALSAEHLKNKSDKALFEYNKLKYGQTAFKKNPDLIPIAYTLSTDFKEDKKYSTALYYAQKVKNNDKKSRFKDISYKTGELNYLMQEYNCAISDLNAYLDTNPTDQNELMKIYAMLADSYLQTAKTTATNPNNYYKLALTYADKALSLEKENVIALETKYTSCFALKSYKSAMETAAKLMQLNPDEVSYILNYADCRGLLNDKKTELIYLQKARALKEKQESLISKNAPKHKSGGI